ncbi:MAG TPA: hypothetical protein VI818_00065 [Candidatus Thermoplasmatota archaeon]|nr:hypothetical protein [Candidatus Thermoplasmatota archaeon]
MRRVAAILLAALLSGCFRGPEPGLVPPDKTAPYATDREDAAYDGPYDLLDVYVEELNGSVVVMMQFRNFTAADGNLTLPKVEARIDVEREGRRTYYAGNEANLSKPAPHLSWVMGRWTSGERQELAEICTENTVYAPEPPYFIRLEFEHVHTGLSTGRGVLHGLHVETSDFEGTAYDTLDATSRRDLRGGPNPHDTCPLVAERPR